MKKLVEVFKKSAIFIGLLFLLVSCSTATKRAKFSQFTNYPCEQVYQKIDYEKVDQALNLISELFDLGCYSEVIFSGSQIRQSSRDKYYSVSAEVGELVTPEGTFTPYVMESYERSYLSILISLSFYALDKVESSMVELKKSGEESSAGLYNYGFDVVNLILRASMTETLSQNSEAEYLWRKALELKPKDPHFKTFVENRLKRIAEGSESQLKWKVYQLDQFPKLDWKYKFNKTKNSFYEIKNQTQFPQTCQNESLVVVSTEDWLEKIRQKYRSEYHPLLNLKSWTRIPVGLGYGAIMITAGAGVGLGGCFLAVSASKGGGNPDQICKISLEAADWMVRQGINLTNYTLKPDMRHWEKLPGGFALMIEEPMQAQKKGQTKQGDSCEIPDNSKQIFPVRQVN